MRVFDASSMIYAWDNYPLRQFPGLWEWMATQTAAREIQMARVAFDEVNHKVPDCAQWLKEQEILLIDVNNEIALEAVRVKGLLGIRNDKYHPKGVDENDLLIIATAKILGIELISDESKQKLPDIAAKRKIPAVCAMNQVEVPCANFLDFIKRSEVIFG